MRCVSRWIVNRKGYILKIIDKRYPRPPTGTGKLIVNCIECRLDQRQPILLTLHLICLLATPLHLCQKPATTALELERCLFEKQVIFRKVIHCQTGIIFFFLLNRCGVIHLAYPVSYRIRYGRGTITVLFYRNQMNDGSIQSLPGCKRGFTVFGREKASPSANF